MAASYAVGVEPLTSISAAEVRSRVLDGIAARWDLDALAALVRRWHGERSTFPAPVLLELAADAFIAIGATRDDRLELEGLADRMLPEWPVRGNSGHSKRRYGVTAAVLIAAGVEPEDTGWWPIDDLWLHALLAVVVFIRAGAERRQVAVAEICDELRSF